MATKFTMDVDVGGNAEAKLDKIASGLGKVAAQANETSKAFNKGGAALDEIASSTKQGAMASMSGMFTDMASKFEAATAKMKDVGRGFYDEVVKDAATFEDAQSEMRFAFGKSWEGVYDQVLKDSAKLTFTFEEVSRLASSLGRMKINPFGGVTEASQLFMSRNGQQIRALEVLQDTADAVGKTTDDLTASLRNAFSGSWKSLQDRFDIPKDKINKWKAATEGLKEPQEKYNYLITQLAQMFGGAGLEKAGNFNKAMAQIPDLLQQIRAGAGMAGLKVLTKEFTGLVDALKSIATDKDIMNGLSEGFKVIAQGVGLGVRALAAAVTWLGELIKTMPWLPKVAAAIAMVAFAFGTFVGTVMAIATSIGAAVAGMSALGVTVGGLIQVGLVLVPLLVTAGAVITALGIAGKASADIMKDNWGGVTNTFNKLKIVFTAVGELWETYNGSTATMSAETARQLQENGLMGTVMQIMGFLHKLNAAWEGFSDAMDMVSEKLGPIIIPMISEVGYLVMELADALGFSDAAMRTNASTTDDWSAAGADFANILIEMTKFMLGFVRGGLMIARLVIYFGHLKDVISGVKWVLKEVAEIIEKVWAKAGKLIDAVGGSGTAGNIAAAFKRGTGHALREAGPTMDTGDMFSQKGRMAGRAYRDDQGNFDPTKGFNTKQLDDETQKGWHGATQQEKLKYMLDHGFLKPEDLPRMAKGRAPLAKPQEGSDWNATYTASGGDMKLAASTRDLDAMNESRRAGAMAPHSAAVQQQAAQTAMLTEIRNLLAKDRVTHIEMNGDKVATHVVGSGNGIAGQH